jgi:hypothetical protein
MAMIWENTRSFRWRYGMLGLGPLYEYTSKTRSRNEEMKKSNQRNLNICWQLSFIEFRRVTSIWEVA